MQVETILARPEGLAEGFRLWITAEPHAAFPIGLLHIGLKLTNEAPVGVKAGLRASYQWLSQVLTHTRLSRAAISAASKRARIHVFCSTCQGA